MTKFELKFVGDDEKVAVEEPYLTSKYVDSVLRGDFVRVYTYYYNTDEYRKFLQIKNRWFKKRKLFQLFKDGEPLFFFKPAVDNSIMVLNYRIRVQGQILRDNLEIVKRVNKISKTAYNKKGVTNGQTTTCHPETIS